MDAKNKKKKQQAKDKSELRDLKPAKDVKGGILTQPPLGSPGSAGGGGRGG